jgi:hypothetical protein
VKLRLTLALLSDEGSTVRAFGSVDVTNRRPPDDPEGDYVAEQVGFMGDVVKRTDLGVVPKAGLTGWSLAAQALRVLGMNEVDRARSEGLVDVIKAATELRDVVDRDAPGRVQEAARRFDAACDKLAGTLKKKA